MSTVHTPSSGPFRSYRLHEFLDDQQRLVSDADGTPFVQKLDGRLCMVFTRRLARALDQGDAVVLLAGKYDGKARCADHCRRCRRVVDFLRQWTPELEANDLAFGGDGPLAVREEFLEFLLNYDRGPEHAPIPKEALSSFLDHWGHRWM